MERSIKCPHCSHSIYFEAHRESTYCPSDDPADGISVKDGFCPNCDEFIVILERGHFNGDGPYVHLETVKQRDFLYPKFFSREPLPQEIPDEYRNDFVEAANVLSISPKASGAISRRLLQHILRDRFGIKHRSLAQEIDDFIKLKDIPSYLADAVDAVRNIGNFAAHPGKDNNTGAIMEVESGEAEWLLEVLEALFDFAFVQPERLKERQQQLNAKLAALGKPPMKTS